MASFADFLRSKYLYILISFSLMAGLAGAYGRERHEGRSPDRPWWISRFCIFPFFAICSAWAAEQFSLSNSQSALVSSLLSLMGYEAVRLIVERAKKFGGDPDIVPAGKHSDATARPYHSVVDVDDKGRATAHIVPTDANQPRRSQIGASLREVYGDNADNPEIDALVQDLDRVSTRLPSDDESE